MFRPRRAVAGAAIALVLAASSVGCSSCDKAPPPDGYGGPGSRPAPQRQPSMRVNPALVFFDAAAEGTDADAAPPPSNAQP